MLLLFYLVLLKHKASKRELSDRIFKKIKIKKKKEKLELRDRILLLLFYRSERRKRGLEIEAFFFGKRKIEQQIDGFGRFERGERV